MFCCQRGHRRGVNALFFSHDTCEVLDVVRNGEEIGTVVVVRDKGWIEWNLGEHHHPWSTLHNIQTHHDHAVNLPQSFAYELQDMVGDITCDIMQGARRGM